MSDFLLQLPKPRWMLQKSQEEEHDAALGAFKIIKEPSSALATRGTGPPPYGFRHKFIPRTETDYGDGGAFPEVHVLQFPVGMGSSSAAQSRKTVALLFDEHGNVKYDTVLTQSGKAMQTRPEDMKPKWSAPEELVKPGQEDEESNVARTQRALERKVAEGGSLSQVQVAANTAIVKPEFYRYTPNQQAPGHNANCTQRIVKMVEKQVDPLEPPKFKHKRAPKAPSSPPPPILHSPPKKLTLKDQQDWKIPPCLSNWKNQKGYTIPLDKRLAADGRNLQHLTVNDKFAALSESLYIAERQAREEIRIRRDMLTQKRQKEEELREQQLREVAAKARAERTNIHDRIRTEDVEGTGRAERERVERDRKREIERDFRIEKAGKKSKKARDDDRDISEKIVLGQAQPTSQEALYDSRLFNQSAGLGSGYYTGEDDKYNVYDKPLFADRTAAAKVYTFEKDRMEQSVGSMGHIPAFAGSESTGQVRTAPVQFERDESSQHTTLK